MKIVNIGGGLGNQMFQYSFYLAMKKNVKEKWSIDISFFDLNNIHNGYELKKIFKIREEEVKIYNNKNIVKRILLKILREIGKKMGYVYTEQREISPIENLEYINSKKRIVFFSGNWISEKYFLGIEEIIQKIFIFPKITEKENLDIKEKIELSEAVSIHVRRGDYLEDKIYSELIDIEYYKKAIEIIKSKIKSPVFFIFSNDIGWCKENLTFNDEVYYINWNNKEKSFRDMQLMSLCKHNIIPHSTFSWWGAWLNKNPKKIVIAPETWFNPKYCKIKTEDIVPNNWIKIRNF